MRLPLVSSAGSSVADARSLKSGSFSKIARLLALPALSLLALPASPAQAPAGPAHPQQFIIGISPYLDNSVKDQVYRGIVRLLVQDLPLDSSVSVYDAFDLKSVTQVSLPKSRAFDSAKTRANQFAPAIRELKSFLAAEHSKPSGSKLPFDSAIRLPQFCDFLVENIHDAEIPLIVLLIGSPLYQDAKEPAFSMADGFFPSDGHLQATREKSVFGYDSDAATPQRLLVHWVYFGDPWISDLHKEKVARFWTLYLDRRYAGLATFTSDLPTALAAFRQGVASDSLPSHGWALDPEQTKVEMLRVSRDVAVTDWLMRRPLSVGAGPPARMTGPMKIGIRWTDNIDLDLYATSHRGADTLFFQHPRSAQGYYYKDHRSSPGREYEFIEFESPVDIREVEAFVNFYKGSSPGGPRGEVRIEFDGRIYGATFSLASAAGNRGQTGPGQTDFWTRIPVQEILNIPVTATAR